MSLLSMLLNGPVEMTAEAKRIARRPCHFDPDATETIEDIFERCPTVLPRVVAALHRAGCGVGMKELRGAASVKSELIKPALLRLALMGVAIPIEMSGRAAKWGLANGIDLRKLQDASSVQPGVHPLLCAAREVLLSQQGTGFGNAGIDSKEKKRADTTPNFGKATGGRKSVKDLSGVRFGRLLVVKRMENTDRGATTWSTQCDCGKEKIVNSSNLLSGDTKSCGCLARELRSERMKNADRSKFKRRGS